MIFFANTQHAFPDKKYLANILQIFILLKQSLLSSSMVPVIIPKVEGITIKNALCFSKDMD